MSSLPRIAAVSALVLMAASAARSQELCAAPPPAPGAVVRGPVLHVLDGETLCVALGATPDRWLRIRLSPATSGPRRDVASPSRGALMSVAFGEMVTCALDPVGATPLTGVCKRKGRALAMAAREPNALAAGLAWR